MEDAKGYRSRAKSWCCVTCCAVCDVRVLVARRGTEIDKRRAGKKTDRRCGEELPHSPKKSEVMPGATAYW